MSCAEIRFSKGKKKIVAQPNLDGRIFGMLDVWHTDKDNVIHMAIQQ